MDSIADIDTYLSVMEFTSPIKILDIGAHEGKFTEAFKKRFPCTSFMFEPSPEQFENLVTNFPADFVFNYGVSNEKRKAKFVLYGGGSGISQLNRITESVHVDPLNSLVEIQLVSLDSIHHSILNNLAFDVCKIDTEGQELNVLRGAAKMLANKDLKYIIFEVGSTYTALGYTVGEVIAYLNSFGYNVYDFVNGKPVRLSPDFNDYSLRDLFATYKEL